jgi:hypothetical protein
MPKTEALARLRTENAALRRELSALQEPVAQLSAALAAAQARISELEAKKTPPPTFVKANAPERPKQPRKKRAPEHNHARRGCLPFVRGNIGRAHEMILASLQ